MKNIIRISALLMFVTAVLLTGCGNKPKPATPVTVEPTSEQIIKKGEYLVNIMGCNDCHSPKKMGPQGPVVIAELMLSGYPSDRQLQKVDARVLKTGWVLINEDFTAAAGPWGVSFSANLTSDQTGIGQWPEEDFKRAVKEGKYKGMEAGRTLLPPMPWTDFAFLIDEDVKAIFAYLQSTKPVKNVPPLPIAPEEIR